MRCKARAAIAVLALAAPAFAAAPTLIGRHQDWKAYSFIDDGHKVCFISSQPKKQAGKFKKRGEVFFFVTRWEENGRDVVSISGGYSFQADSRVKVEVDGGIFEFFTQGEMAWAKNQAADEGVVRTLQTGKSMAVKGVSRRGTKTTDTYSLKGAAEAYQSIVKECMQKGKTDETH